jgi:uncharacterized RDD family membrane protein YckC
VSAPSPPSGESLWGHYAGSVSRLVAFVVDLVLSIAVYEIVLAGVSYIAQIVTGHSVNLHKGGPVVLVIFVLWEFVYFGGAWSSSGRTPGMALLGICVVRTDGAVLGPRQGWLRAIAFPLGFLTLGVGFIWILVDRERRAVYDVIAGTTVVYAWDARVGRIKFLARPAGLGLSGRPPPKEQLPPPTQQLTPPAEQLTPSAQLTEITVVETGGPESGSGGGPGGGPVSGSPGPAGVTQAG